MTRRVVITGLGIVSSIGNNKAEVLSALREAKSGIVTEPTYVEMGFRSQVAGTLKIDLEERLDRKTRRFMGEGVAYNYIAFEEALEDAGLSRDEISDERTGIDGGGTVVGVRSGQRQGTAAVLN